MCGSTVDRYTDYLELERLLDAQRPASDDHDEMLFIVLHQVTELWLKLIVYELDYAKGAIAADDLDTALGALARVTETYDALTSSWRVLATMTPANYRTFRDRLGPLSGLGSVQHRAVDGLLGRRAPEMLAGLPPGEHAFLVRIVDQPSLYDDVLVLFRSRGLAIPAEVVERDWQMPRRPSAAVEGAWREVYLHPRAYPDLHRLGEHLVDLEEAYGRCRLAHRQMIKRMTGSERGDGGPEKDRVLFPELWELRRVL